MEFVILEGSEPMGDRWSDVSEGQMNSRPKNPPYACVQGMHDWEEVSRLARQLVVIQRKVPSTVMPEVGSIWITHLFAGSDKTARVVVLPWEKFKPLNQKQTVRVALATTDGKPNSAHWWRSVDELIPVTQWAGGPE